MSGGRRTCWTDRSRGEQQQQQQQQADAGGVDGEQQQQHQVEASSTLVAAPAGEDDADDIKPRKLLWIDDRPENNALIVNKAMRVSDESSGLSLLLRLCIIPATNMLNQTPLLYSYLGRFFLC